ncbi:hypothetical protein AAZX31_10G107900 [Glycine max]
MVVEEGVRWRKEEERGVSLWVLVVEERKGVELREEDDDEEEDDAQGNNMSLEEAVAEEIAMAGGEFG